MPHLGLRAGRVGAGTAALPSPAAVVSHGRSVRATLRGTRPPAADAQHRTRGRRLRHEHGHGVPHCQLAAARLRPAGREVGRPLGYLRVC
jgi:hypothetical protein